MQYLKLAAGLALMGCSSAPASNTPPAGPAPATPVVARPAPADVFSAYLRGTFGHTISPTGEHWYVVIPAVGCQGCAHAELRELAGTAWAPNVTVVTSGLLRDLSAAERKSLTQHTHLLADTLRVEGNTLDRLTLPFSTLTGLVHTRHGQVVAFTPFDKDSYQRVFAALPKRPR